MEYFLVATAMTDHGGGDSFVKIHIDRRGFYLYIVKMEFFHPVFTLLLTLLTAEFQLLINIFFFQGNATLHLYPHFEPLRQISGE